MMFLINRLSFLTQSLRSYIYYIFGYENSLIALANRECSGMR
jgi:hypothetical protein